jgi:hypothetical protein
MRRGRGIREETGRYERKKMEWERGKKGLEGHKRRERGEDRRKVVGRWLGRRLCSQVEGYRRPCSLSFEIHTTAFWDRIDPRAGPAV